MNQAWRFWFEVSEGLRIAAQQIAANRIRSFLSALGVSVGIVAVTLMGAAIGGIEVGFERSMSAFGNDVFYVEQYPWNPGEDYAVFRNRPDIKLTYTAQLNRMIQENPHSLLDLAVAAPSCVEQSTTARDKFPTSLPWALPMSTATCGQQVAKRVGLSTKPKAVAGETCVSLEGTLPMRSSTMKIRWTS